jgi:tetratricopeptide (TPR) repeat protein
VCTTILLPSMSGFSSEAVSSPVQGNLVLQENSSCRNLPQGIVIENVAKNSEMESAGLVSGDVVLRWTQGDLKGEIDSPFDFSQVQIEQGPRRQLQLEGMRGNVSRRWSIGARRWGVSVRPNLPEHLLDIYRTGEELSKSNEVEKAIERWREAASEKDYAHCSWLSSWFLSRAATEASRIQSWKETDNLFQEAIGQLIAEETQVRSALLHAWSVSFQQRDDWPSAQKYEMQALEETRRVGSTSLVSSRSLTSLGRISYFSGNLVASDDYFQQALAIRQKLAPESLDVAEDLGWLADVTHEKGDLSKAENYGLQALAIESQLAPGSSEEAQAKGTLAYIASDRGDLARAEHWESEALEIRRRLDPISPEVAKSLNSLGIIEARRGNLDGAEDSVVSSSIVGCKRPATPTTLAGADWPKALTTAFLTVLDLVR